ncbi:MAG: DUF3597 domain-containing protein, partial [Steroidobacteraceae bacterium]
AAAPASGAGKKPVSPASAPAASSPTPAPARTVDIETVMKGYESKTTQKLNWRTSIVDLLKLLDIDPSLENRKELARELGYTGSTTDSAAMNIWLHKQVLRKLQENGGNVPASLID